MIRVIFLSLPLLIAACNRDSSRADLPPAGGIPGVPSRPFAELTDHASNESASLSTPDFTGLATARPLPLDMQGDWYFNEPLTLAAWKKSMTPRQYQVNIDSLPQLKAVGIPLHVDLRISGNAAIGQRAVLMPRYDFTRWDVTEGAITARAWHHEDQYDPGDMYEIDLRLQVSGKELWWEEGDEPTDSNKPPQFLRYIYTREAPAKQTP